ncbi:leucine-rich repeat domain-containing protein [Ekhidna sp.]|uniref:leucine-rich repeat domain-containing protein n=1 Tax=Ekhidna sp. TaxID=2608089 RepID=UPI003BA97E56
MKKYTSIFLLVLTTFSLSAQSEQDSARFEQVRSLLNFYEYMLNSIGAAKTSTRDKEVIITQSYKKVFESNSVQIEDDLIDDREVITNKDVTAYLRDVDFFFTDIQFDFNNVEIEKVTNDDSSGFFLVSFESTIEGKNLENNDFKRVDKRFMEVNYNDQSEDLKIASIYSTKVSREKELQNWWMNLSYGWKSIFDEYVEIDSITVDVLKQLAEIDSLSLEGNSFIRDIEPLAALKELKFLNISNTQVQDLEPLRYSMNLQTLIARNSSLKNIDALRYFENLKFLDLSQTAVIDIQSISKLKVLESLNLSNTSTTSFEPLNGLSSIKDIDLSNTAFSDLTLLSNNRNLEVLIIDQTKVSSLSSLSDLKKLRELKASETKITDLEGLSMHPSIKTISVNRTEVSSLSPLADAPELRKVYADYTNIPEQMVAKFMTDRPSTLVITNSEKVRQWWDGLSANWKNVFSKQIGDSSPQREDLIKFINRDSLDLSDQNFYELEPLQKFKRIRYLNVSNNLFTSFDFTKEMNELSILVANGLPVESTEGLENNLNLEELYLSGTLLKDISHIHALKKLRIVDVDDTKIDESDVIPLLRENLVIIFQSAQILSWWNDLSTEWKEIFDIKDPSSLNLHRLIEQQEVTISNKPLTSLTPLTAFINLKRVYLDNLRITSLSELLQHQNLEEITCINGPLESLEGISQLRKLKTLNIRNTAIDDIKELDGMKSIQHLNCAGTGVKNLKGISELYELESLDISNTRVWKLERLYGMQNLKKLVCYNTRLRQHTVDDFKTVFPNCQIDFY